MWTHNSANNPANPDATRDVYGGTQTCEEMIVPFFGVVLDARMDPRKVMMLPGQAEAFRAGRRSAPAAGALELFDLFLLSRRAHCIAFQRRPDGAESVASRGWSVEGGAGCKGALRECRGFLNGNRIGRPRPIEGQVFGGRNRRCGGAREFHSLRAREAGYGDHLGCVMLIIESVELRFFYPGPSP